MTIEADIPAPHAQKIPVAENLFKAGLLIAMLLLSFYLAQSGVDVLQAHLPAGGVGTLVQWAFLGVLGIINCVLLTGMGVLAHEAVHKVLFKRLFWNEFWGGALSALTLIPFYANRQFHLTHHSYAHQPGYDPENSMHHRPFWYAVFLGALIGIYCQYRILAVNASRWRDPRFGGRALKDAGFVLCAGAVYLYLVPSLGIALTSFLVPTLLAFPLVFALRAISDHYGLPPVKREIETKREMLEPETAEWPKDMPREVTGWVVLTHPLLEWLWSHVNYHEVHHKYPYLSHRYLKPIFRATYTRLPYQVVNGYLCSLWRLKDRPYYPAAQDAGFFTGSR